MPFDKIQDSGLWVIFLVFITIRKKAGTPQKQSTSYWHIEEYSRHACNFRTSVVGLVTECWTIIIMKDDKAGDNEGRD